MFLKEHAAYICAECLAARLELPLPQTMMVTLGLQQVETTEDLCSLCHGRARVIRAKKIANARDGGADSERINMETDVTKRVLIVDDEPNVVGVLLEFFARFQHRHVYDVVSAYSAAEALDILPQGRFDLILLDMGLPGIGTRWKQGLGLLKRIRDLGEHAPVLMMSGGGDAHKAEALIAGAVGYLHKPFNLRDLDRSVALTLGPRAASG